MSDDGKTRKHVIGIDLGTTFSVIACLKDDGKPETIPNSEGDLKTPSSILFDTDGQVVVGREAKNAAASDHSRIADCPKRDLGSKYYHRPVNGKMMSPVELSAFILKKLVKDAEDRVGPIAGAVITVPAFFDESRRQATVNAGTIAGVKVIDIINEPTAAALAYAFRDFVSRGGSASDRQAMAIAATAPHTAIVFDLGGGTLDVTLMRISGEELIVLATDGDVRLGGNDWDQRIVDIVAEAFIEEHGEDPRKDDETRFTMLQAAERAKMDLSKRQHTRVVVTYQGKTFKCEIDRAEFDKRTADLLYRAERRLESVLKQGKLTWADVDEVLAVGGSTRMPQVPAMLQRVTGKEPNLSLPPDEVVAHGAAIHGAIRVFNAKLSADAEQAIKKRIKAGEAGPDTSVDPQAGPGSPPDDGLGPASNAPASDAPALPQDDFFENFNPDEIAIPDDEVGQRFRAAQVVNVNSHSLGVAVVRPDGQRRINKLIPKNSKLPHSASKRFGLVRDNQNAVNVQVFEGESDMIEDCIRLGTCTIENLPSGLKRGDPIDVKFTYDQSGRLHVEAVEVSSGRKATSSINRETGMSQIDVERARQSMAATQVS